MNLRRTMTAFVVATGLVYAGGTLAQAPITDPRDLDERLKRLERLFDSGGLFKLFEEVKSLGIEIGRLQGQLEEQAHTINRLRQGQRELYRDVDQRLQSIESAPAARTASPSPQSAPPTAPPPATPPAPAETAVASQPAAIPSAPAAPRTTTSAAGTPGAVPATEGVDPFAEQQAYQSAFDLLKSGRYEDAAVAFQKFLNEYPGGSYADNAQYWLGETHYIKREYKLALQEFGRLVSDYPGSQKLAGSLLKIGYTHDELGNKAEAERVLDDLVTRYPQSAAAGLARKRLLRIRGQ